MKENKDATPREVLKKESPTELTAKEKAVTAADPEANPEAPEAESKERVDDVVTEIRPGLLQHYRQESQEFTFTCDKGISLRVSILAPDMLRFRYAWKGEFQPDFSYAIDPAFAPVPVDIKAHEEADHIQIHTGKVTLFVYRDGLRTEISDEHDDLLLADSTGYYRRQSILEGVQEISLSKKAADGEKYFGLGDKCTSMNLRGYRYDNWNLDAFGYGSTSNELYRSIPFYYGLNNGRGYGIFLDNTYKSTFDFAKTTETSISFGAAGGELNYYFIYGPELLHVAERYTDLTGKAEMPPLWALGYHQCKWSYYPEQQLYDLADEFRSRNIPCDALYLDIDYMDEYRVFTWNEEHFPNPRRLTDALKEQGFKTVVMIDPGVKADEESAVFQTGSDINAWCRRTDGTYMRGPVWPPECVFPDYTDPKVRDWWANLYQDLLQRDGVDGVWNDMNEPAVFEVKALTFPQDVRHHYEGYGSDHKKAHNIYGMQMSRASQEGLQRFLDGKRPFVITRATYAGGQRYASVWTGDNTASWEHLQIANLQCQRMAISGFSFIGSDVGGFVDKPSGELYARWVEMAVFHPFFRTHSMGSNVDGAGAVDEEAVAQRLEEGGYNQEPWSFGDEITDVVRGSIEERYKLLPYIYTTFWQYASKGTPCIRPLYFYDQEDSQVQEENVSFLFGDALLVSPVVKEGVVSKNVHLPSGHWYNYWTEEPLQGNSSVVTMAPLGQTPIFVKAGTLLPVAPVLQHVGEKPIETLALKLYYASGKSSSQLYEDAGEGMAYASGECNTVTFDQQSTDHEVLLSQDRQGNFKPEYQHYELILVGLPHDVKQVIVDGKVVADTEIHREHKDQELLIPASFQELKITLGV